MRFNQSKVFAVSFLVSAVMLTGSLAAAKFRSLPAVACRAQILGPIGAAGAIEYECPVVTGTDFPLTSITSIEVDFSNGGPGRVGNATLCRRAWASGVYTCGAQTSVSVGVNGAAAYPTLANLGSGSGYDFIEVKASVYGNIAGYPVASHYLTGVYAANSAP